MLENEKRLQQEIENVKSDRDTKVMDQYKYFEIERENLKTRIAELEAKYKDAENKRSSLIFEFEKVKLIHRNYFIGTCKVEP